MMKTYTMEDFIMDTPIREETGRWEAGYFSGKTCWNINYSGILTFLIQKAGTICAQYASDLFISWSVLEKELEEQGRDYSGGKYLFGFRDSGVDHDAYVLSTLNHYGVKGLKNNVKELYMLEISIHRKESVYVGDEIKMRLGKIDMDRLENQGHEIPERRNDGTD